MKLFVFFNNKNPLGTKNQFYNRISLVATLQADLKKTVAKLLSRHVETRLRMCEARRSSTIFWNFIFCTFDLWNIDYWGCCWRLGTPGQAQLRDQSINFTLPIWVIGINFFRVMFFGGNIVSSEIFQLGFVVLISDKKHTINWLNH